MRGDDMDPKATRWEGRVSLGNIITMVSGALMLAAAWGALQTDFRALAQRVDKGEIRDDKTAEALEQIKGAITEMKAEQKATRVEAERLSRQLDRAIEKIENFARPNPAPGKQTPPN